MRSRKFRCSIFFLVLFYGIFLSVFSVIAEGIDSIEGSDLPIGAGGSTAIIVGGGDAVLSKNVEFLGKVGIGTAKPTEQLDVVGTIRSTGKIQSADDVCITAGNGKCLSDEQKPTLECIEVNKEGPYSGGAATAAKCPDGYMITGGACYPHTNGDITATVVSVANNAYYCAGDPGPGYSTIFIQAVCCKIKMP